MLYGRGAETACLATAAPLQLAGGAAVEVICMSWARDTWGRDECYHPSVLMPHVYLVYYEYLVPQVPYIYLVPHEYSVPLVYLVPHEY